MRYKFRFVLFNLSLENSLVNFPEFFSLLFSIYRSTDVLYKFFLRLDNDKFFYASAFSISFYFLELICPHSASINRDADETAFKNRRENSGERGRVHSTRKSQNNLIFIDYLANFILNLVDKIERIPVLFTTSNIEKIF